MICWMASRWSRYLVIVQTTAWSLVLAITKTTCTLLHNAAIKYGTAWTFDDGHQSQLLDYVCSPHDGIKVYARRIS